MHRLYRPKNCTITVDLRDKETYLHLLDDGKAFLEVVIAFILSISFAIFPSIGAANEVEIGLLINKNLDEEISARCQQSDTQMQCQFAQVLIKKDNSDQRALEERKKAEFDQWKKKLKV